jgi:uncharacterized protein (TIGR02145 family)
MKDIIKALSLFSLLVILAKCNKDPVSPPTYNDQGNIGKDGGIVKTEDGAIVEIPSGALNTSITISISNVTMGDTVANNGCRIYKLEPDGLSFSDSIIITLPIDDTYTNLFGATENYGVSILVYQDSEWVKLLTKVDLNNKTAQAKTTHFSYYSIDSPSQYSDYYFNNKNIGVAWDVPYYMQTGYTCGYYSLSMLTKYAGYQYKAPFFLSLMDEGDAQDKGFLGLFGGVGLAEADLTKLDTRLSQIGIKTEIAKPPWANVYNLMGYILEKLLCGYPVFVGSEDLRHAFVVTGNNSTGFFINDPGGIFLAEANQILPDNYPSEKCVNVHVTYEQFHECLKGIYSDFTIVIKSFESASKVGLTMNFHESSIDVVSVDQSGYRDPVGALDISGIYKPGGYKIVNSSSLDAGFDGRNFLIIAPRFANSNLNQDVKALVYCKIDEQNVPLSPLIRNSSSPQPITIPLGTSLYTNVIFGPQLSNLSKGNHAISLELRSEDSLVIYDSWNFEINIANEYMENNAITDIDGNVYNTVTIGSQTWMAENLKTTKYCNGDLIGTTNTATFDISGETSPKYQWAYDGIESNVNIYGRLYTWYTVTDSRKICPTGWRVPTDGDWIIMQNYLIANGYNYDGTTIGNKIAKSLSATNSWISSNITGAPGNTDYPSYRNVTGFTALPGGFRGDGIYYLKGSFCIWWSSAEDISPTGGWSLAIGDVCDASGGYAKKSYGLSVRCLKDN